MDAKLKEYVSKLNDCIASLIREKGACFFMGLSLTQFPIYLDEGLCKEEGALARITGDKIIVSPEFFEEIDPQAQKHTLCHEVMHFLCGHLTYGEHDDDAMNIAMDMIVNQRLLESGFPKFDFLWYLEDLSHVMPLNELKKMSEPEIRDLVLKHIPKASSGQGMGKGFGESFGKIPFKGKGKRRKFRPHRSNKRRNPKLKKLKDGSFDSRKYFDNLQRLKEMLEKMVKIAGQNAGCFKEILGIEVKRPTWKIKLRRLLASCLSSNSKLDLTREHRK
ncbi:MAG: hypothetical protein DRJ03_25555, partial [Chloroflexi bacterium]